MNSKILAATAALALAAPAAVLAQTATPAPTVSSGAVPNPQTANDPVPPAMPADPTYQGTPYKGALTPPPPQAMNKTYPVCGGKIQDSCINPSAAREK